jgi:filamentous hemagglutinin family protein
MRVQSTGRKSIVFRQAVLLVVGLHISGSTAFAGPEGAAVAYGTATFQQSGNYTTIQASDRAIINYHSFDVAQAETVEFIQPGAGASVLNRILSANPTTIDGTILANGRVFFVNPAGVIFGESAQVNVAQLVASALDISNTDFINGRYEFKGGDGSIINKGQISAEQAYLIGKQVANLGSIDCPGGYVVMAAGDRVFLGEPGTDLLVEIDDVASGDQTEPAEGAAILNEGSIDAAGGSIVLAAAGDIYALAISNVGKLSASSTVGDGGSVKLAAPEGTVVNTGSIEATSESGKGGDVQVLGTRVGLFETSQIDVSGAGGGGSALIGGDYRGQGDTSTAARTSVGPDASIRADATETGDGGKVIVWADEATYFAGSISARGGEHGGNGGFVEVSGKDNLGFYGQVDAQAPQGDIGTLLLDPTDIVVANNDGSDGYPAGGILFDDLPESEPWNVSPAALSDAGASVRLQANHDITFNDTVTLTKAGVGLTAEAGHSISINADIATSNGSIAMTAADTITTRGSRTLSTGTGAGNITLDGALELAGDLVVEAGTGNVTFLGTIDSEGDTISDLTVNSSGTTRFSDTVGGTRPIGQLTTDAGGTTEVNANIITSGGSEATQIYNDPVVLTNDATLTDYGTTGIFFNSTVTGDGVESWNLGVTASEGEIQFNDAVTVDGGILAYAGGNITANALTSAQNNISLYSTGGDLVLSGAINADRDAEGNGGGVLLYSSSGRIYTPGGSNDTLNVNITGYSDASSGVSLTWGEGQGRVAIYIYSADPLILGTAGTLTARGTYTGTVLRDGSYTSETDDRDDISFSTNSDPAIGGAPIDVAVYLGSSAIDGAGVTVGSAVTMPKGGTMVVSAYGTVEFGGNFASSSFHSTSRLEVVSWITSNLDTAADRSRFPYAENVIAGKRPTWFHGHSYVLRGSNDSPAYVLAAVGPENNASPPLPTIVVPNVAPPIPQAQVETQNWISEAEDIVGPIVPPHPECLDVKEEDIEIVRKCQVACDLFSTDVSLNVVAEDIVTLNGRLKAQVQEILPRLDTLSRRWPRVRPGDLVAVEQALRQDQALGSWLGDGVEFVKLLRTKLGEPTDECVEKFLLNYLKHAPDESVLSFVQTYLKSKLALVAEAGGPVAWLVHAWR